MLSQGFMDEHQGMYSQMGFHLNSTNLCTFTPLGYTHHQQPDLKPYNNIPSSLAIDHAASNLTHVLLSSTSPKPREYLSSFSDIPSFFSLERSTPNLWAWGEGKDTNMTKRSSGENHLGVSAIKMKKMKTRRKVREPRFCFKTMSDVDVLDDGYKWRKYGQKVVKNTLHPRSYYRCTKDNCRVKKRVERLAEDPRMVITTYEGRHVHSPSHDLDESQGGQPLLNNFFW